MTDIDNDQMIDRISAAAGIPVEAPPVERVDAPPVDNAIEDEPRALNLNDLATRLEMDVADLYSAEVTITDEDGNPTPLPIGKLKDVYQESLKGKRFAEEARRERESYQERQRQAETLVGEVERQARVSEALLQQLGSQYMAEFNAINWAELQESDPAMWAAKRADMRMREEQLRNMASAVNARLNEVANVRKIRTEQERRARQLTAENRLRHEVPEWRDPKVMRDDMRQMSDYMMDAGFTADEVQAVDDYRSLSILRKAWLYDRMTNAAEIAKKKVLKTGGKPLTGGARQSVSRGDDFNALKARLRKTHHVDDAAKLIAARLGR